MRSHSSPSALMCSAAAANIRNRMVETIETFATASSESSGEIFNQFVSADSVPAACRTFWQLLSRRPAADCEPEAAGGRPAQQELPYRSLGRLEGLPWRARSVWGLLDDRARRPEYAAAPLSRRRAVVCGAGPCGLRVALELALLGAEVTIVEKRNAAEACGRINRLHLWEWCKQDLLAWGAKIFNPPGGTFGGDNDFCHIGIGELQLLLLKPALLLGVRFRFGAEAARLDGEGSALICSGGERLGCDMLFVADGANSRLSRMLGLRSVLVGLRGRGSAIGVVANFVNSRDQQQMALRQFSWARQFNLPLFAKLKKETATDLENVVYFKGPALHYMVMTPTKRSLVDLGVLRDGRSCGSLLHTSNVDAGRLSGMVQGIASFFGLPTELCEAQGAMIFDFSGVRRLESAATMVAGVFVCAVGDALLEPFWPEGLGILRGFMSAMDAAHAAVLACGSAGDAGHSGSAGVEEALVQIGATYNILKSVAAQTAAQCLQKDLRQYRLAPETRYLWSPSSAAPERCAS